jgi:hypothetical protein
MGGVSGEGIRVEAIPEAHLRPLLKAKKTWSGPGRSLPIIVYQRN